MFASAIPATADIRLVTTISLKFEESEPAFAPPYAILSHTLDGNETSYQELQADRKAGKEIFYEKLISGCCIAAEDRF